ncbi:unnamed protein product [Prorocentrum cordatum]|uniref:Uncharacterized protein n=1 Tax=Prorocentrum cordatum TaxID=2364126 RepID=A0ABN9TIE1_9DINO|nr:unnamed protein product [Polarella glacialis]
MLLRQDGIIPGGAPLVGIGAPREDNADRLRRNGVANELLPLQQLHLCILFVGAFGFWHCYNVLYKHTVLNVAEVGSLFTRFVSMVLSGLLAGGAWSLTLGCKGSAVMSGFSSLRSCGSLWVRIKFFWGQDAAEKVLAEGPDCYGQREGTADKGSTVTRVPR